MTAPPRQPTPAESEVVELRLDESGTAGGLRLRWIELDDSRCPIGVTCIWEGQAIVTLRVRQRDDTSGTSETVELTLRAGFDSTTRVLSRDLKLLNVAPHPRDGVTPQREDHVATLEVKPQ